MSTSMNDPRGQSQTDARSESPSESPNASSNASGTAFGDESNAQSHEQPGRRKAVKTRYLVLALIVAVVVLRDMPHRGADWLLGLGGLAILLYHGHDRLQRTIFSAAGTVVMGLLLWMPSCNARLRTGPGDPFETPGQRTTANWSTAEYDATQASHGPLPLPGGLTVALQPNAHLSYRKTNSRSRPNGYVAQLDGDATFAVPPGVDHLAIIGSKNPTAAVVSPGRYMVHGDIARDSVWVNVVEGKGNVRGRAVLVNQAR